MTIEIMPVHGLGDAVVLETVGNWAEARAAMKTLFHHYEVIATCKWGMKNSVSDFWVSLGPGVAFMVYVNS